MIRSRRRWAIMVPLNKEESLKRGIEWNAEHPTRISIIGMSMKELKQFTTKEQRRRNYADEKA